MPHFTMQMGADGPFVNAAVAISEPRAAALKAANQPVPPPVRIRALIDTGASCTCVDPSVLTSLDLSPTGQANINTPSTGATPHVTSQYDVSLIIPGSDPNQPVLRFDTISVVAVELLAPQGFHALIGRDILGRCLLYYNGELNFFSLAY